MDRLHWSLVNRPRDIACSSTSIGHIHTIPLTYSHICQQWATAQCHDSHVTLLNPNLFHIDNQQELLVQQACDPSLASHHEHVHLYGTLLIHLHQPGNIFINPCVCLCLCVT